MKYPSFSIICFLIKEKILHGKCCGPFELARKQWESARDLEYTILFCSHSLTNDKLGQGIKLKLASLRESVVLFVMSNKRPHCAQSAKIISNSLRSPRLRLVSAVCACGGKGGNESQKRK